MKHLPHTFLLLLFAPFLTCCEGGLNLDRLRPKGNLTLRVGESTTGTEREFDVFVTVADIRVDGTSLEGFQRQTVNLAELDAGSTHELFMGAMPTGTYSEIQLVFDTGTDAHGNGPGCYVIVPSGDKRPLLIGDKGQITVDADPLVVKRRLPLNAVVRFDLRNALRREDPASGYYLPPNTWESRSVRLIQESAEAPQSKS